MYPPLAISWFLNITSMKYASHGAIIIFFLNLPPKKTQQINKTITQNIYRYDAGPTNMDKSAQ